MNPDAYADVIRAAKEWDAATIRFFEPFPGHETEARADRLHLAAAALHAAVAALNE